MRVWYVILAMMWVILAVDVLPNENWESGYVPLSEDGDEMFYFLCKSRQSRNRPKALVLYLNGGPGTSTVSNLFFENGPYLFNVTERFNRNEHSWNNEYDVLYVDNPLSVGFSITRNDSHLCTNRYCLAGDLYKFLKKFYEAHVEYSGVPFIVAGMSYAGHYVPPLSRLLLEKNVRDATPSINYTATVLFAPWLDPRQLLYDPQFLYENQRFNYIQYLMHTVFVWLCETYALVDRQGAYGLCAAAESQIFNVSKVINVYNIDTPRTYHNEFHALTGYLNSPDIFQQLGAKKVYAPNNFTVRNMLRQQDYMMSYLQDVAFVLDHNVPVLVAYGNKDLITNWHGGQHAIESAQWAGQETFRNLAWNKAVHRGVEFGLTKSSRNLAMYILYGAGHFLAKDQPLYTAHILTTFINSTLQLTF